jgi:type 1 glutamine amidotransferase
LARGKQGNADNVVVWTNEYGPKKTRVFSTSIGHNTATVADERYLDLVTRGVLWATGKLGDDGKPAKGYEAKAK